MNKDKKESGEIKFRKEVQELIIPENYNDMPVDEEDVVEFIIIVE